MPVKTIITEGVLDGLTWLVILGGVLLALSTQALKAAGLKPPLSAREITIRSLGAGLASLTLGLVLLGTGKIELNWALYLGLGGVVGYWGQEALGWLVQVAQVKGGQMTGTPVQPPAPPIAPPPAPTPPPSPPEDPS